LWLRVVFSIVLTQQLLVILYRGAGLIARPHDERLGTELRELGTRDQV
jgi:hypothetical protein